MISFGARFLFFSLAFHRMIGREIFQTKTLPLFPRFLFFSQAEASPFLFDSVLAADDSCQLQQEPSARFGEIVVISFCG